jgi:L-2-hydroxyglutarate oxidase LhgO
LYQADIVIVGAGVIGLAIASQVAREGREVYVLEKKETFGKEASSHNSEVIHTSLLYPKGSFNAEMAIEGNALLYELCEKYSISHKKIGKLVVAVDETETEALEQMFEQAKEGGADLEMLSRRELNQVEPNVRGVAAIFSPATGIIDSVGLMRHFLNQARDKGAQIAYKKEVVGIDGLPGGYKVEVKESSGNFAFMTRILINCAGLYSDKVAAMCAIDIIEANYKLYFCKGEYYSLSPGKGGMINHLVYPMPLPGGLTGIHSCSDVWGRKRLGPDFYYVDEIDYKVNGSRKHLFYNSAKILFPFIEYDDIEAESAGIMARVYAKGEEFKEFVIRHEYDRDLPGFINLVGIESPGLTASPVIAKYVSNLVDGILGG